MKLFFNKILLFSIVAILAVSCGSDKREPLKGLKQAENGDVYYGGTFILNEVENFRSLFPPNVTDAIGYHIATQIYEGLVRFNQRDLSIEPAIAEEWEIDSTATVYTFKIRKGVKFHDDKAFDKGKGREVTAHDVKYSFDRLCTPSPDNSGFFIFKNRVKGASEHYKAASDGSPLPGGVSGVEVVDDYTLRITLERPFAGFPYILSTQYTWVYPEEAYKKYGSDMREKTVGTGPFFLDQIKEDEAAILKRNKNYWGEDEFGNKLPYLEAIKISFIKEKKAELLEFKKGNLDMIHRLPLEMVDEVIDKDERLKKDYQQFQLQRTPSLAVNYYGFQHKSNLFDNADVRKAFNYAVDRRKIVDYTLKGMAIPGNYGIVPPAVVGYNTKDINGYVYDPDKARDFMAKAGYENGEGFPELTLQINSGGGRNKQIAEAIQKMLEETLNIKVNIAILPWSQHLDKLETGNALFWRTAWRADYPSPENFLNLLYSVHIPETMEEKSYVNSVRYASAKFDSLFEKGMASLDEDERNKYYIMAEKVAIQEDAAIMPLYYDKDYRLLQPYVANFYQNPMEYRNFRDVYFIPKEN